MNNTISIERKMYLKNKKKRKYQILFTQLFILIAFVFLWEILGNLGIINPFITSQPSRILKTLLNFSFN